MTEFVLEILDGDRAGEILELTSEPMTFGRRQGNTVVLKDEKCSGRHATIVLEEGAWILRDLDSTNGTLLDGRRVDEVGLTANDIFQLGVTRVAFKEKGAPTPRNDLSVKKVDQATLARTRRGGGIGLLLILVLALGGGAVWFFFLRGGEGGVGPVAGARVKTPLSVPGNLVTGGDFEDEESETPVFERVAGLGFEPDFGASGANTGTRYLLAARTEDAKDDLALARSARLQVSSGGSLTVKAFVMTTGKASAAIRARFTSSNEERPQLFFTGTKPAKYEDFTEVTLAIPVPEGCDRAQVELLGFLPDDDSTVSVDDVSAVSTTTSPTPNRVQTSVGQRATWSGTSVQIDDGQQTVLLGLRPTTRDPVLQKLAGLGLLGGSDIGMELAVREEEGAIVLACADSGGGGVTLRFGKGIAASGVLVRKGDEPFTNRGREFQVNEVDSLLLGYKNARLLVQLPQPGGAVGVAANRAFELTIAEPKEIRLVYDFGEERGTARALLDNARTHDGEKRYKDALTQLGQLLATVPHDDTVAAEAASLRTKIRARMTDAIRNLESELDEALYFGSLRGYRRIARELAALVDAYGSEHLLEKDKVEAMQARVASNIAKVEKELGEETRKKLEVLARIYGGADASKKQLADLIKSYIEKHLPPKEGSDSPAPGSAPPKNGKAKENE